MIRKYSLLFFFSIFFISLVYVYSYSDEYSNTFILLPGIFILLSCIYKNILNPSFLCFTIAFYYLFNSFYLDVNDIHIGYEYIALYYIVILLVFLSFRTPVVNVKNKILFEKIYNEKKAIKYYISIYIIYLFFIYTSFFLNNASISTIIRSIILSPVEAIIYGLIFVIFSLDKRKGFIVFCLFCISPFLRLLSSGDVNRASLLYLLILFFYLYYIFIKKETKIKSILPILLCGAFYSIISIIDVSLNFRDNNILGGDSLIINNANNIIEYFNNNNNINHEWFMFFHNIFTIVIPENLWFFGDKLTAYNPSAWYIENILGYNIKTYPWGVGVSIIGSGYIYGGFIGVILLILIIIYIFNLFSKRVNNSFLLGIYVYFIIRVPYALFRMDESFLIPIAVVNVALLMFLFNIFNRNLKVIK